MDIYHTGVNVSAKIKNIPVITMGFPTTLFGVFGFIVAVIFLVAISASDLFPAQIQPIKDSQTNFLNTVNNTANATINPTADTGFWGTVFGLTGLDGIYTFITNSFSMAISFMIMVIQYLLAFIGIAAIIPTEFYLLFLLMSMAGIVAIIKLFLWGE